MIVPSDHKPVLPHIVRVFRPNGRYGWECSTKVVGGNRVR